LAFTVQQLEADRPNLIETQNAGDLDKPMVIEVIVEKDGPVSLELLPRSSSRAPAS
jgi:hypothetical protein